MAKFTTLALSVICSFTIALFLFLAVSRVAESTPGLAPGADALALLGLGLISLGWAVSRCDYLKALQMGQG